MNNDLPKVKKTCRADLVNKDGQRFVIGTFELEEPEPGPKLAQFADVAFKAARSSLQRLMVPDWRVVVIDGDREEGYGLDRWIKLVDRTDDDYTPKKQRIRKHGLVA